ncbi:hypothetical protein V8E36_008976 [Tilletia maclaganii]
MKSRLVSTYGDYMLEQSAARRMHLADTLCVSFLSANTIVEYHPTPEEIPPDQAFSPILHTIPILADFRSAEIHIEANSSGTPEYLSPERARGDLHDERLTDLWRLGLTFFEVAAVMTDAVSRISKSRLRLRRNWLYTTTVNRTMPGSWGDTYSISHGLEDLRAMPRPDPFLRMESADALLHPYIVDSELLQDAEADELSSMTDDLDASLGAVVLAQLQAVKAERSRMQTSDTSIAEHSG